MKRFFCTFLALILLLGAAGAFVACNNGEGNEQETEAEAPKMPIVENGKSNYIIVYPDKPTANEVEAAYTIREKIHDVTGVRLKSMNEEFMIEEPNADVIYVGNTTFAPAKTAKDQISQEYFDAYAIESVERNIYFVAASDSALIEAANYFAEQLVEKNYDKQTRTLYFEGCRFNGETVKPSGFLVENIRDYAIIYPKSEGISFLSIAKTLQTEIKERTGYTPDVYEDVKCEEGPYEILLGETNRELSKRCYENTSRIMEYEIVVEQCKVQLAVGGFYTAEKCIEDFSSYVLRRSDTLLTSGGYYKKNLAELTQPLTSGADIRIMSANVLSYRWGEAVSNKVLPVAYRCEIFAGVLLRFGPDAVGIQETDDPWFQALPWYLSRLAEKDGIEYTFLFGKITHEGVTMNNFSTIVYRSDLYNLDASGYEVFSIWQETPSYFQRVATYAKLISKTDPQKQFILVNTHWAHEDAAMVSTCAVEEAALVNRLKQQYAGVSIFCTGDFNNLSTRAWRDLYLLQFVTDIEGTIGSLIAKELGVLITPGGCRGSAELENVLHDIDDSFIDHIIYTGGACEIKRHDTIRENKCNRLTDHAPIYADFDLK